MTPAPRGRAARRAAPAVTAATALAALTSAIPAAATAPSPGPAAARGTQGVKVIDVDDPDLALREGARLATPKVLALDSPQLSIDRHVEAVPRGQAPDRQPHAPASRTPAADPTRRPSDKGEAPPAPDAGSTPGAPARETPAASTDSPAAPGWQAPTVLIGGGCLAAAAVLAALAVRRARRDRTPDAVRRSAAGASARAVLASQLPPGRGRADGPPSLERLDAALRTLARHCEQTGRQLPALRAARISADTLEILPDVPATAPQTPFESGPDGWWSLAPATGSDLLSAPAADAFPAPCPALTALGTTTDGSLLLLNLAQYGVILLNGDDDAVLAVCRSLVLEQALSPWTGTVRLITVGFGRHLSPLLPHARLTPVDEPGDAVREVSEHLLETGQLPASAHQPCLLISARPLDADTAARLAELLSVPGRAPVTVIAPAGGTGPDPDHTLTLDAAVTEPQLFEPVGCEVRLQRLDDATYQQLLPSLQAHASADADLSEPTPDQAHLSDVTPASPGAESRGSSGGPAGSSATDPSQHPDGEGTDGGRADGVFPALAAAAARTSRLRPRRSPAAAPGFDGGVAAAASGGTGDPDAPEIRVLGLLEVDRVPDTGHGPRAAQLAALLYFHPHHSAEALCAAMDPHQSWGVSTLNARLNGLRRFLGDAPDGTPYVPRRRHGDDPYQISPRIRCDWSVFRRLTHDAHSRGPDALPDLERALALVRGRPFGDRPPAWAEPLQQQMTTAIADTAYLIATHRSSPGPRQDLTAARHAVTTALDTGHHSERLYRAWMTTEHLDRNHTGLRAVIDRLQAHSHQLGTALEPETEQLIRQLLAPSRS
ncbi:hypothetical protein [Streptomyces sp. NPDC005017]|uniref:hypothetical protein n=1 Tax=Streptomyces sp. NPDC005017 TaxID=3364706 RepID=UPI0036B9C165